MTENDDSRWHRLMALHEELDALVSQRYRSTDKMDPSHIPGTPKECDVWNKMTDPEFTEILETIVASSPVIQSQSGEVWKKALKDSVAKSNLAHV